jgi:sugar lactone lactonase YvrE
MQMELSRISRHFINGDNILATSATLRNDDVIVDTSGNILISDCTNHRVRKIDSNGYIFTIAGTGTAGYSGDNGQATSAQINGPNGLATDSSGNIYIGDRINQRIRKIDSNGVITTVAGNGQQGYSGDNGPATSAQLNSPNGVTPDASGNMYITDRMNHIIRKVDANGIITTIAGTGTGGYNGDNIQAINSSQICCTSYSAFLCSNDCTLRIT